MSKVNCICYSWTFLVNLSVFLSLSFLPLCVSVIYVCNAYTSVYGQCRVCVSVYGIQRRSWAILLCWEPVNPIYPPTSFPYSSGSNRHAHSHTQISKCAGMFSGPHAVPTETSLQCPFSPFKIHSLPLAFYCFFVDFISCIPIPLVFPSPHFCPLSLQPPPKTISESKTKQP